jgi:nicotinamide-nucleotide amidase
LGGVRLRLTARGNNALTVKEILHKKANELTELVRSYIIGFEKDTIETVLHHWFIERGLTLGLAESCTGGYIAHRLTSLSGSSVYFKGGVVVYSNELKRNL